MSLITLGSLREENRHFFAGCRLTLESKECSQEVGDNLSGMLRIGVVVSKMDDVFTPRDDGHEQKFWKTS